VVEVLSASTEAFDRGDKFADYQALDSLEEYVLINTRHQRIECFRRNDAGLWVLQYYTPDQGTFSLTSLDFADTLAALYEDVELESPCPPASNPQPCPIGIRRATTWQPRLEVAPPVPNALS
jgi:hypothetical protein